jgi:hypothetical protein
MGVSEVSRNSTNILCSYSFGFPKNQISYHGLTHINAVTKKTIDMTESKKTRTGILSFYIPAMFLALFYLAGGKEKTEDILKYVDPFICTKGDNGQLYPGAGSDRTGDASGA